MSRWWVTTALALAGLAAALAAGGCPGSSHGDGCAQVPGCEAQFSTCCGPPQRCSEYICQGVPWTCIDGNASPTGDGYQWQQGRAVDICGVVDSGLPPPDMALDTAPPVDADAAAPADATVPSDAPKPDGCACAVGTTQPCGPCNLGTRACKANCSGYETQCNVPSTACTPQDTKNCGNCNKGTKVCDNKCAWGACTGQPCKPGDKQSCPNGCGERTCDGNCGFGSCSLSGQYLKKSGTTCFSQNNPCPGGPTPLCVACWLKCDDNGNTYKDAWCASCSDCGAEQPCP